MKRKETENYEIDFVLSWMNPYDDNWRREKAKYWAIEIRDPNYDVNQVARFRDWDNLQYWFRGVEKFAPWVGKVYFVTWDTVPEWLNLDHPKLQIVRDREIIPGGAAPAFSPNPMETNLHRIPGISERFVFFNDDMFLLNDVFPSHFYKGGLPCEMAVSYPLTNAIENDPFQHMLFTMTGVINSFFDKKTVQKKHWRKWYSLLYGKQLFNTVATSRFRAFSGIMIPHLPSPMRKSTYEEVWNAIPEQLMATASHKFRNLADLTQYIFRYWAICKGEFAPTNVFRYGKEFFMNDATLEGLCDFIRNQRTPIVCVNDSKDVQNFEKCRDEVKAAFQQILPEKSSFEK